MEKTHLCEDVIWSFLAGDLPEEELELVEAHLEQCDLCSEQLANLAEIGEQIPELLPPERLEPLEQPSPAFADRVMAEVTALEAKTPLYTMATISRAKQRNRLRSPRFEWFTRAATAAVVTGFMVLGTLQTGMSGGNVPVVGEISALFTRTGTSVSDGTELLTAKLDQFVTKSMDWKPSK